MKQFRLLSALSITLCVSSLASAKLIDFQSISYTNIDLSVAPDLTADHTLTALTLGAVQTVANPASIQGAFIADTPADPTLTLSTSDINSTGNAWYAYQVDVFMGTSFSLSGISVGTPPGWSEVIPSYVAPHLNGTPQFFGAGEWVAEFLFSGSPPILPGSSLDFSYTLSFSGSQTYGFAQEMTPITQPVPEPSVLALAAIGGLALTGHLRRNRRAAA